MQTVTNSRFLDLGDEPIDRVLSPIKGYRDKPLIPLIESVKPLIRIFNGIQSNVYLALQNCANPPDGLTQDESASIYLYTMEFIPGPSLHTIMNQTLRMENRQQLRLWLPFLKLFLTALYKLPSQCETVWRGVREIDISTKYRTGMKFPWWGVSSCTSNLEILQSKNLLNTQGQRTILAIQCLNGKSISNHSQFRMIEKEMLLIPGSYFEVIGQINPAPQLHIIQLKEIPSPTTLIESPFFQSSKLFLKGISLHANTRWKQDGLTVAGGNGEGEKLNQFYRPFGMFVDDNQTIYIADFWNHRIIEWKSNANNGQIVAGGNRKGGLINQLNSPTDVIIDKQTNSCIICDSQNRRVLRWSRKDHLDQQILISNIDCYGLTMDSHGYLYVSDSVKHEVRRWKIGEKTGTLVAGGHGPGSSLYHLNYPTYLFVDQNDSLYVSDHDNHRVLKWIKDAKTGIVVAGGNNEGDNSSQLYHPQGVFVDQSGHIYVADSGNDRIMRWLEGATEGTIVVGGCGQGQQSNQFNSCFGLSVDLAGNLYVVDCWNNRIQKFGMN